jgi:hypothetical protein
MKARLIIAIVFILTYSVFGLAQSGQNATYQRYSHSELRRHMQNAHTPEQYRALASYFRSQQSSFQSKAAQEKDIWSARAQNQIGSGEKYPRPIDSAHYLYDSYVYDANRSSKLADHYEQLADSEAMSPKL